MINYSVIGDCLVQTNGAGAKHAYTVIYLTANDRHMAVQVVAESADMASAIAGYHTRKDDTIVDETDVISG